MRILLIIGSLIIGNLAFAQNLLDNAISHFQNGDLNKAQIGIDSAVLEAISYQDPYAWYFKGVIYKELYKENKDADTLFLLRTESANSFKKSIELDNEEEYKVENLKNLKYLATTLFNEATISLNALKFELSQQSFDLFKSYMRQADTMIDLHEKEIQYLLFVASTYNRIYNESSNQNEAALFKAKETYNKVIEIDQGNLLANYNMGIIFYNEAVRIIKKLEISLDIMELRNAEMQSIELFKKSLPYMELGHEISPDDKNIVEALYEIYYSLNEEEKADILKEKLEGLND